MMKTTIALHFLAMVVLIRGREFGLPEGVDVIDVPQNKRFSGNVRSRPTTARPLAECTVQIQAMPAQVLTALCTCRTTPCASGQICTRTAAGVGTCTLVPTLPACATTTGSMYPPPCTCVAWTTPPVQNVCTAVGMASCVANMCAP